MRPKLADFPRASRLCSVIADARIKSIYGDLICTASSLHERMTVEASRVEVRILFMDRLVCRIVPYRELLHLQIGESPTWEIRVRDEGEYVDAFDRLLAEFLRIVSHHSESLAEKEPSVED